MNEAQPGWSRLDERMGVFQLAILILSLLLLGLLAMDTFWSLPKELSEVIQIADTLVCALLWVDFGVRFARAQNKIAFLKWGWIDLVASIPNIDLLRWGRLVRILRIIRLLRAMRSLQRLLELLLKNRAKTGAVSLGLMAFLLIALSSMSILIVEQSDSSNIRTAEDAIWWSVTTVTTVGYGDKFPVTTEGRIIGVILMISGIGMFGGLSGLVASMFLGASEKDSAEFKEVCARLDRLQAKVDQLSQAVRLPEEPPGPQRE